MAYFILNEKLHRLGILGCVMCIVGSVIIVLNAPQEKPISSVQEIWSMATQPGTKKTSLSSLFSKSVELDELVSDAIRFI